MPDWPAILPFQQSDLSSDYCVIMLCLAEAERVACVLRKRLFRRPACGHLRGVGSVPRGQFHCRLCRGVASPALLLPVAV